MMHIWDILNVSLAYFSNPTYDHFTLAAVILNFLKAGLVPNQGFLFLLLMVLKNSQCFWWVLGR